MRYAFGLSGGGGAVNCGGNVKLFHCDSPLPADIGNAQIFRSCFEETQMFDRTIKSLGFSAIGAIALFCVIPQAQALECRRRHRPISLVPWRKRRITFRP